MKRLLAFLFVGVVAIFFLPQSSAGIFDNKHISRVCVVSKSSYDAQDFLEVIESGEQFYYLTDDISKARQIQDFDGVVIYFDDYDFDSIVRDYNIDYFQGESIDGNPTYYGYTSLYKDAVSLKDKRVNVQLLVKPTQIIVGFPVILTGY